MVGVEAQTRRNRAVTLRTNANTTMCYHRRTREGKRLSPAHQLRRAYQVCNGRRREGPIWSVSLFISSSEHKHYYMCARLDAEA